MAATMAMSNNPEKAQRAVTAMGLRSGLSPTEVKDTIDAAREYCSLILEPKNGLSTAASPCGSGSGPVSSVLDSDPSLAVKRLGRILLAGGLTKELVCSLPPAMTDWMLLEEYRRWWAQCSTHVMQSQLSGRQIPAEVSTSLSRMGNQAAEQARNCGALLLQLVSSLPTVPSWPSTLSPSATLQPPPIGWGTVHLL